METLRNRFVRRLVCLAVVAGLLLNPALPVLRPHALPVVRAAASDSSSAVSGAVAAPASVMAPGSGAASGLRPPEPTVPPPTPTPAAIPPGSRGVLLRGDLAQAGQEAPPKGLCSAGPEEQGAAVSGVTPLSTSGAYWWHRSLDPSDEPFACPGGGANAPNRVMYPTDACNLLYVTVVNPVDNERYTWTFYRPDGSYYTSGSYTFYYPDNPANPMPGYYVWRGSFYYWYWSYYPSSWSPALGLVIAGEEPSWMPGKWLN